CRRGGTRILGKSPSPSVHAEHLIAWCELRHVLADRFDLAGYVNAQPRGLGQAQPARYAHDVRLASHVMPVEGIDGSRANSYQDEIVPNGRLLNLLVLKNIGRTVAVIHDGFHAVCCPDCRSSPSDLCESTVARIHALIQTGLTTGITGPHVDTNTFRET